MFSAKGNNMIYGIIAICLLFFALIFIMLKRTEKTKRNKILKWLGISLGVTIFILTIFNLGYYFGCEQQRVMLKGEQAFSIALCKKVINSNEDPKKIIDFIFKTKTCALIANKEFDDEPFYEKMLSLTCYRLLDYDDSMNDFSDGVLASLCVEIDSYNIDDEDKQLLQALLKESVEPKLTKQIDSYILHNKKEKGSVVGEIGVVKFFHPDKKEKSENEVVSPNSDSAVAKPE